MSALEVVMMKRIGELNEEVKRLKAEVERLRCLSDELNNTTEYLELENARLRKAGDAMALCITEFRCGKYGNALDKVGGFYVWQDWLVAKEGRPNE